MPRVFSAIACNLDVDLLAAALPLLEEERVQGFEWSFDALFQTKELPLWFVDLIEAFSQEKRLLGHGVFFSLFSGKWSEGQKEWLQKLRQLSRRYHFDHITEHFGFMTGKNFHHGAPLNLPFTPATLAIGRDRLAHIQDACQCPVGLENLAFAYSLEEVKQHGEFLEQLVAPINGFLILDLHNLYCQLHNFSVPFEDIIRLYPLERVREIHLSGGSWETSSVNPARQIRRDTHDT
ncbi:multinuclear nonheme iron-dependent oxidase [Rufibacter immobilis]|uniref:multinuclear nonheme iron-dependent oxidase n=1 Tax=Rufibacter immobilis TaxID=1348778 RepID=UPI0035E9CDF4